MPDTPLNSDALEVASREVFREVLGFDKTQSARVARRAVTAYLAVAQPVVNSVELDRLPIGSIVLDATGTTRTYVASEYGAYYADCYGEDGVLELPARVLYRPGANGA
ncbi:hypothetical protein AQ436_01770 [Arthrobacter sp. EpRS66]|nr:hypothetical protein AQ436_01770 [Arthrobacter sp. EpRS66]